MLRIAPQRLAPVGLRRAGCVVDLSEVHADAVQLIDSGDLLGGGRLLSGSNRGRGWCRHPANQYRGASNHIEASWFRGHTQFDDRRGSSGKLDRHLPDSPTCGDANSRPVVIGRRDNSNREVAVLGTQAHGGVHRGGIRRADAGDRIPELREHLRLAGGQPGKIGLIVGEHPRHQLHVLGVVVGQIVRPSATKRRVPPRPLLLAHRNGRIGDMHEAGVDTVVVPTEELPAGIEAHVGGGDRDVAVEVQPVAAPAASRADEALASSGGIVHAVVNPVAIRETDHGPASMIGDVAHIGWKERLVIGPDLGGGISPPQEGLDHIGAVVQPHA